jgi:hypothetical protein
MIKFVNIKNSCELYVFIQKNTPTGGGITSCNILKNLKKGGTRKSKRKYGSKTLKRH